MSFSALTSGLTIPKTIVSAATRLREVAPKFEPAPLPNLRKGAPQALAKDVERPAYRPPVEVVQRYAAPMQRQAVLPSWRTNLSPTKQGGSVLPRVVSGGAAPVGSSPPASPPVRPWKVPSVAAKSQEAPQKAIPVMPVGPQVYQSPSFVFPRVPVEPLPLGRQASAESGMQEKLCREACKDYFPACEEKGSCGLLCIAISAAVGLTVGALAVQMHHKSKRRR